MAIVVSATEAKNQLGRVLANVASGESVVIERNGKQVAAIISAADLEELERRRRADRRRSLLAELNRLNAERVASHSGLDDAAAETLGVELGKEFNLGAAERLSSKETCESA